MTAVGIMYGALVFSPANGIKIIKVFQMADYLVYYNIENPTNVDSFLTVFQNTPLSQFPNPFNFEPGGQDESGKSVGCTAPRKFEESGVSCYVLTNLGQYLLQGMIIMFAKMMAMIATAYFKDSPTARLRRAADLITNLLNIEFVASFLDGTQIDVYMSAF
jgi:hypothetical protein